MLPLQSFRRFLIWLMRGHTCTINETMIMPRNRSGTAWQSPPIETSPTEQVLFYSLLHLGFSPPGLRPVDLDTSFVCVSYQAGNEFLFLAKQRTVKDKKEIQQLFMESGVEDNGFFYRQEDVSPCVQSMTPTIWLTSWLNQALFPTVTWQQLLLKPSIKLWHI